MVTGELPWAERFGRAVFRRRWAIIVVWLGLFAAAGIFAPRVTSILKGGGYNIPTSQANKAYSAIQKAYKSRALAFTVVFRRERGASLQPALRAARLLRGRVHVHLGRTLQVGPPVVSPDRRVVFVRVFTRPRQDFGIPLTANVRPLVPSIHGTHGYVTGASAIFYDMEQTSDSDLRHMEIVTFPIALIILLLIFGTVVAAFVPVSMGPLTVTSALAAVFFLGHWVNMSIFVLNTASMLGLGVAIDYSLFMVQRFREELSSSQSAAPMVSRDAVDVERAIGRTVATSGVAILTSALTVAIGFLGMTLFRVTMLTSLGIGGSVVVAISLACALTFLPAVLSVLGNRVNALATVPPRLSTQGMWHSLAGFVMRKPWPVIVGVTAIVLLIALPARAIRVGVPGPDILPTSAPSRTGDGLLRSHIGLANQSPVLLVLRSPRGFGSAATRLALFDMAGRICSHTIVAGVAPAPVVNSPGAIMGCRKALRLTGAISTPLTKRHTLLISIFLRENPSSAGAEEFVGHLRSLSPPKGVQLLVGGQTAAQLDFDNFIYGQFPLAILFVVGAIFATLAITFRSLLLPLKAIVMNGLSVLAAYGATVAVFQDGFLRSVFGFTPTGFLDSIVPVFIFCVLFGLSTDYEVFLLSRVREEYRRSKDNTASVALGLERTGRMITSAAIIMVVIFGAFSFANLVVIKELGLAMAVGVLVDATLIRALLVPAAMRVLGYWNWWPGDRSRDTAAAGMNSVLAPAEAPGVQ